ncbi:MAG: hypothetical protein CMJ90_14855, partial [Planctomycetes bacterium]|nr:hypothetical protein [Planctomycetota bacterium]
MLGGAGEGEERRGHQTARFRLPGGDRIVETSHLGIELARALQCDKLHLVGTPGAYFDRLLDLLPNSECEAPVKETAPLIQEAVAPDAEAEQAPDAEAEQAPDAEAEQAPDAQAEQAPDAQA